MIFRHARRTLGSDGAAGVRARRRSAIGTANEFKQRLRMRRFLLASLFAILYILSWPFSTQNMVDWATPSQACVIGRAILAFHRVPLGFNLHFSDPSLTGWQLLSAVYTMLFVIYRNPDTRLAFTAFFFVALIFGMLRMTGRTLAKWGGISILSFAVVIWLRYIKNGDADMLRIDAMLCAVMALTFPWVVYFGEREETERG